MHVNFSHTAFRSPAIKRLAAIMISFCAIFLLAALVTDRSESELFSKRANLAVNTIGHNSHNKYPW
jgi:hypothetical protein